MGNVTMAYVNKKVNKVLQYAEGLEKRIQELEEELQTLKESNIYLCWFCGKPLDKKIGYWKWSFSNGRELTFCYDCNEKRSEISTIGGSGTEEKTKK